MTVKVGLLIVATGRYAVFLPPLLDSVAEHFFPEHERTVFVFSESVPRAPRGLRIVHTPTPVEPWPLPTLKRYHYFTDAAAALQTCDVLFYLDADTRVVGPIDDAVLPTSESGLLGAEHPHFSGYFRHAGLVPRALRRLGLPWPKQEWVKAQQRGTFESNPRSTAYVAEHEHGSYFIGAFNGGTTGAFLTMAERIRHNVDQDLKSAIVALWHDESHLNRYFLDHPPQVLSPSYAFPEGWQAPYPPRILLLDKDHAAMRAPLSFMSPTAA